MSAAKEGMTLSDLISHFTKSTGKAMPRGMYGKVKKPDGAKEPEKAPEPVKAEEKPVKNPKEPSYERRRH